MWMLVAWMQHKVRPHGSCNLLVIVLHCWQNLFFSTSQSTLSFTSVSAVFVLCKEINRDLFTSSLPLNMMETALNTCYQGLKYRIKGGVYHLFKACNVLSDFMFNVITSLTGSSACLSATLLHAIAALKMQNI